MQRLLVKFKTRSLKLPYAAESFI